MLDHTFKVRTDAMFAQMCHFPEIGKRQAAFHLQGGKNQQGMD